MDAIEIICAYLKEAFPNGDSPMEIDNACQELQQRLNSMESKLNSLDDRVL